MKYTLTESGCHEFVGHKSSGKSGGYGVKRIDGKVWKAHRLAWTLAKGEIPDGLLVCHKCDNRACINVDHLFLGTVKDNCDDMYAKGRGRKALGESHGNCRFSSEDIVRIREAYLFGAKQTELAAVYGTYQGTIGRFVRNEERVS